MEELGSEERLSKMNDREFADSIKDKNYVELKSKEQKRLKRLLKERLNLSEINRVFVALLFGETIQKAISRVRK